MKEYNPLNFLVLQFLFLFVLERFWCSDGEVVWTESKLYKYLRTKAQVQCNLKPSACLQESVVRLRRNSASCSNEIRQDIL